MREKIKKIIKNNSTANNLYNFSKPAFEFFSFKPLTFFRQYVWFFHELRVFKKQINNKKFKELEYYPCLFDNLTYTPLDPTYFFQDSWAAKHIFDLKPTHHYDVGSSAKTMGIISQFTAVTMVDIRPIELELPNLFFRKGSILELPFEDGSIDSLSSLCVVEHIGLGRYGDPVDSFGSEKAIIELKRVLSKEGVLLFSVPVDKINKIFFNAHRAFTRDYIMELFDGFVVIDEKYHYGTKLYDEYDPQKGFGTGLFMMKKMVLNVYKN